MRLRRGRVGCRAHTTSQGRVAEPSLGDPCRPQRSPPSTTIVRSAVLRGRKYGLSCPDLLELASVPAQPLRPTGRGLAGVGAGGDQGARRRIWLCAQRRGRSCPTRLSSAKLTQQPDSASGLMAGRGNRTLPRATMGQGWHIVATPETGRTLNDGHVDDLGDRRWVQGGRAETAFLPVARGRHLRKQNRT